MTRIIGTAAVAALLVVVALCDRAAGQATPPNGVSRARAYLSQRVVHVFDFEERQMGNFESLPRNWRVIAGPGFPDYTADRTGFDTEHHVSGDHALKLQTNGGSSGIVLDRGAIAAVPGADYIVTAELRTEDLKHARVRLVGYFVNQHGRRIEPSMARSDLTVSNGKWTRLKVRLSGNYEQAAWIVLRLELLQSSEFRRPVIDEHELYHEDIGASAWFDDVSIFQLPRIEISTDAPTNILRAPARPKLSITVRDLTGERLTSRAMLYDQSGREIAQQRRVLGGRHAPQWTWSPNVPRFGWYWADLQVTGERGLVGRRMVAMCWMPEANGRPAERRRFGVVAERLPDAQRRLLPKVLRRIGSGAVITDVWNEDLSHEQLGRLETEPDPVIAELIRTQPRLTLSLAGVPQELAILAKTDADMPLALLAGDEQIWKRPLQATLVRYGQQVRRWQLGAVGSSEAFWRDDLGELYSDMDQWFSTLVPEAALALPWSAEQSMAEVPNGVKTLNVRVPTSIQPGQIGAYTESWPDPPDGLSLIVEALPAPEYDHRQRAEDLALRLVEAWRTNPATLYVRRPWNGGSGRGAALVPDPLLAVFANTIDRLAERRVVGRMRLARGVRCYILDGPGGGALVAWNESSPRTDVALDLYLGRSPRLVDVWGNQHPLETDRGAASARHVTPIGSMPVYIEGINAKLARFRAGLRFDPDFVESSYKVHPVKLRMSNPWTRSISGRMRITSHDDWTVHPRVIHFNIPAKGQIEVPVDITFPISELAGEKMIEAAVHVEADREYDVDVSVPLEIGLPDIEYHSTLSVEPGRDGGTDVVITALVTNRGAEARSLYAFAVAPQRPGQQRIVARLEPQDSVVKRFRFPDAANDLSGRSIRVGLREMDGPAMLNQKLDVP